MIQMLYGILSIYCDFLFFWRDFNKFFTYLEYLKFIQFLRFSFLQKRLTGKDYELPEGVEIKQEKIDSNNGNDEDFDEEVEVVYEEEEED